MKYRYIVLIDFQDNMIDGRKAEKLEAETTQGDVSNTKKTLFFVIKHFHVYINSFYTQPNIPCLHFFIPQLFKKCFQHS